MGRQFVASGNELMKAIRNAALKAQQMEPVHDWEFGGELLTEPLALTMVDLDVVPEKDPDLIYAGYRLRGRDKRYEGIVAISRRTGDLISGTWSEVDSP